MKANLRDFIYILLVCSATMAACGGGGSDVQAASSLDSTPSAPTTPPDASPVFQGLSGDFTKTVSVAGVSRTFLLHVPPSYNISQPSPAVLLFHGGTGSATSIGKITSNANGGFSAFADQKNFIAIYPNSVSGTWDDGRSTIRIKTNDVAFTAAVLDALALEYNIDRKRIYAAGFSNGGMFTLRLACELSDRLAAVATVGANMPMDLQPGCNPVQALPLVMFSGVADSLMPFEGGAVAGVFGSSGVISSTGTAAYWAGKSSASLRVTTALIDADPADGTTTEVLSYTTTSHRQVVALYRSNGGGHAWPGGMQYAPVATIGRVVRDFSANEVIWAFFLQHTRTD
jgi:polyhydroxybutyrate depolymerase